MTAPPTVQVDRTAIYAQHGRNGSYLEIVPEPSGGVRVQPTESGKGALNRFWTMWLRELILEQTDLRRTYSVEVRDHSVHVNSKASARATIGTLRHIASEIRPLNDPPLLRRRYDHRNELCWDIKYSDRFVPWELITQGIQPRGAQLECWQWEWPGRLSGHLRLTRPSGHSLSTSQLGMLVELGVAQACHR